MRFIELFVGFAAAVVLAGCGGVHLPDWGGPDEPQRPIEPLVAAGPVVALPPPQSARTWDDYKVNAARRLVSANPERSYMGKVPDILLAIPVIEIELNRDGSVRRMDVKRYPGQAEDTVPLALTAIRRASPFGDVSHLPRPWKFTEVFLFNDDRRFKPRTLDD